MNITEKEYENAKQHIQEAEKQKLIDDFEKGGKEKTDYSIEEHDNTRDFFYGVPVFKDGKLEGFNMMTFSKFYDEIGMNLRSDDKKYLDENGNQVFMNVDEYFKFYKDHEVKDGRLGAILHKVREADKIENYALNNSKFGKVRNKLAKSVDKVLETNLAEKKIAKPLKKIEKAVSDKLLGKVRE